ncbi:MAG TPA: outer membrane protein assembly factor BamD [Verrucomicrobiae bacterium]|nr:outer membrane protein assembly factor BamD [Verrucomicrobiae bacterium]
MSRRTITLLLLLAGAVFWPFRSPAPLVYTPGEGWTYEAVGEVGRWKRQRAKDQLDVAREAFDQKNYKISLKAAQYLVRTWPLSDYAADAQYLVGRSYEARRDDEKAFKAYQKVLENYPRSEKLNEVLQRQYQIALRFLGGQRFKLWGLIPFFPDMEKTAGLFEQIVKSGPYSSIAPDAQLSIGTAHEKRRDYSEAVAAYERAADRYNDQPVIAAEATYRAGLAYTKQARTAEYDQGTAGQAIATFKDFINLYPDDKRVPEAKRLIDSLKEEQARGSFQTATFYASRKKWKGAMIYYNEALLASPSSKYAAEARERMAEIRQRVPAASLAQ